MTTKGDQYFAMFLETNQQRINNSLLQASKELEFMNAQQQQYRDALLAELADERKLLKAIQNPDMPSDARLKLGRARMEYSKAREAARRQHADDWDISGERFSSPFSQAATEIKDSSTWTVDFQRQLQEGGLASKYNALATPGQRKEAFATMSQLVQSKTGFNEARANVYLSQQLGASEEDAVSSAGKNEAYKADLKKRLSSIMGSSDFRKYEEQLERAEALAEGGSERLGEEELARGRIKDLEADLEDIAIEPVRMEGIRARAGEIYSPFMDKAAQETIELGRIARAESLPAWKKKFAASGKKGILLSQMSPEDRQRETGTAGSYASNLFEKIKTGDFTLQDAIATIEEQDFDEEQRKTAIATLVSHGIQGANAAAPPPVEKEDVLKRMLRKVTGSGE